jgi:hypothetical protein
MLGRAINVLNLDKGWINDVNQMDKGKFNVTEILWSFENKCIFSVNE